MVSLASLVRVFPTRLQLSKSKIPYLRLEGEVNRQMTAYVQTIVDLIPQNKTEIVLSINSRGGCPAQAHIIIQKLKAKAQTNNMKIITFAQEYATNAAFLLLTSGHYVVADSTSVLGGLHVGKVKFFLGKLSEYSRQVTYANEPSLNSQLNRSEEINGRKKAEIECIYSQISEEMGQQIQCQRGERVKKGLKLGDLLLGREAREKGLVDELATMRDYLVRNYPQKMLHKLQLNKVQKFFKTIRQLNLSD